MARIAVSDETVSSFWVPSHCLEVINYRCELPPSTFNGSDVLYAVSHGDMEEEEEENMLVMTVEILRMQNVLKTTYEITSRREISLHKITNFCIAKNYDVSRRDLTEGRRAIISVETRFHQVSSSSVLLGSF